MARIPVHRCDHKPVHRFARNEPRLQAVMVRVHTRTARIRRTAVYLHRQTAHAAPRAQAAQKSIGHIANAVQHDQRGTARCQSDAQPDGNYARRPRAQRGVVPCVRQHRDQILSARRRVFPRPRQGHKVGGKVRVHGILHHRPRGRMERDRSRAYRARRRGRGRAAHIRRRRKHVHPAAQVHKKTQNRRRARIPVQ